MAQYNEIEHEEKRRSAAISALSRGLKRQDLISFLKSLKDKTTEELEKMVKDKDVPHQELEVRKDIRPLGRRRLHHRSKGKRR